MANPFIPQDRYQILQFVALLNCSRILVAEKTGNDRLVMRLLRKQDRINRQLAKHVIITTRGDHGQ